MHIGLFDSGVGGLTVLREIKKVLPQAQFTYLGDTARLPYGNKAPVTLRQYTTENIQFLDSLNVDVIVIACHSASSFALDLNSSAQGTPIFNVIGPSCVEALNQTHNKRIGILATKATTKSGVYSRYINDLDSKAQVFSQQAPLLVPLVEEDYGDEEVTQIILKSYLTPLLRQDVDTIVLGCTHYPILMHQISQLCGSQVTLIDPARSVAESLAPLMKEPSQEAGEMNIYLTDHAPHFLEHAAQLLNSSRPLLALKPLGPTAK